MMESIKDEPGVLDLGNGHYLKFFSWSPDRELNPQYESIPDIERMGALVEHPYGEHDTCLSGIYFDLPEVRKALNGENKSFWKVEKWEPLTLSPSLLCRTCGDHGFVREGRWVKA